MARTGRDPAWACNNRPPSNHMQDKCLRTAWAWGNSRPSSRPSGNNRNTAAAWGNRGRSSKPPRPAGRSLPCPPHTRCRDWPLSLHPECRQERRFQRASTYSRLGFSLKRRGPPSFLRSQPGRTTSEPARPGPFRTIVPSGFSVLGLGVSPTKSQVHRYPDLSPSARQTVRRTTGCGSRASTISGRPCHRQTLAARGPSGSPGHGNRPDSSSGSRLPSGRRPVRW